MSSSHLLDAAVSRFWYGIIGSGHMPPDSPMGFIGVQETSNIYGRANSSYRAPYGWGVYDTVSWNWRASWSYVTGGHSAKLGYTGTEMKYDWVNYTNPSLMRYTFNSTAPATASCVISKWHAPLSDRGELHDHGELRERQSRGCSFDIPAGSVDARPDDAARCVAMGLRVQLGAGRGQRHGSDEPLHIDAHPVSAHGERDGLQRPQSAPWSRVRSLRQRQDRC